MPFLSEDWRKSFHYLFLPHVKDCRPPVSQLAELMGKLTDLVPSCCKYFSDPESKSKVLQGSSLSPCQSPCVGFSTGGSAAKNQAGRALYFSS